MHSFSNKADYSFTEIMSVGDLRLQGRRGGWRGGSHPSLRVGKRKASKQHWECQGAQEHFGTSAQWVAEEMPRAHTEPQQGKGKTEWKQHHGRTDPNSRVTHWD